MRFSQGRTEINSVSVSPRSNNPSNSKFQPNGRPPGDNKNDKNNNTKIHICTDGSCSDVEDEIDPTCTNVNIDATNRESTARNQNSHSLTNLKYNFHLRRIENLHHHRHHLLLWRSKS